MTEGQAPPGVVSLSAAIASLRGELTRAWWDGRRGKVRFKPAPIELTLQVAVTGSRSGSAGVSWWLLELGGSTSQSTVETQTIKLTLDPVLFDNQGQPVELLIDAEGSPAESAEHQLDAPGY